LAAQDKEVITMTLLLSHTTTLFLPKQTVNKRWWTPAWQLVELLTLQTFAIAHAQHTMRSFAHSVVMRRRALLEMQQVNL